MTVRLRLVALLAVAGVSVVLLAMPVSSRSIRLAQLAAMAIGFGLLVSLGGRRRWVQITSALALLPVVAVVAPSRPFDSAELRAAYVSELRQLGGVRYVWGGEGRMGVDCSGLPRKALLDATFQQGLATRNPGLLRAAAGIWWNDLSARAIGSRHRRSTVGVSGGESIRLLDHSPLVPGDLAVTRDGQHMLVFLEGDRWIQADPAAGEVITVRAGDDNPWLGLPVRIVRWRLLV